MSKNGIDQAIFEIHSLLEKGGFKAAATAASALCKEFPHDPRSHLLFGFALISGKKFDKGRRILQRAVTLFPKDWKLHAMLGQAFLHLNDLRKGEDSLHTAIRLSENAAPGERAELHCRLADLYWVNHRREEALESWRTAVKVDPSCEDAHQRLRDNVNMYGEAKAPNPAFDDLYHFMNIHKQRYFRLVGREEFETQAEAKAVIGIIMGAWNELVSPVSREMDDWTPERRSKYFTDQTLDFRAVIRQSGE